MYFQIVKLKKLFNRFLVFSNFKSKLPLINYIFRNKHLQNVILYKINKKLMKYVESKKRRKTLLKYFYLPRYLKRWHWVQ